jgi:hypothetical protein
MRCRAGAFKGTGEHAVDEVRLALHYTPGTPIAAKESVVIDAPLDQPKEFELMIFLRAGTPDIPKSLRLHWNCGPKNLVVTSPTHLRLDQEWRSLQNKHEALFRKKTPTPEERQAAKKQYDEGAERYRKGMEELDVAYVFNPEIDLDEIPRLWMEWVEVEGPVADWPPKARTELFFDGEARPVDGTCIREIFTRFLPRAYRRPVEPKEIDAVVAWVLKAREAGGLSGLDAIREGLKMVLCSPKFLMLQEPAGTSAAPRRLTDHELACRSPTSSGAPCPTASC